ncbi:hypothetical protein [Spiroplasma eriocheiris]|uniref:Transmembrane protein n=1 Tax=Spiroplasma eriocheiris TaxID=315358 RepID=A0A0H3XH89_9MOLU|nr:hypothetical protein [Spiroplasma eriocheiris]AHF57536.1 hypothetical protein SPE_0407 [Spiroplasma eriocheiris CCTCC M 207170]AKM53993.1 hypothetical protein SERIO_v1c04140 [Spiroplasma eriocheiris]
MQQQKLVISSSLTANFLHSNNHLIQTLITNLNLGVLSDHVGLVNVSQLYNNYQSLITKMPDLAIKNLLSRMLTFDNLQQKKFLNKNIVKFLEIVKPSSNYNLTFWSLAANQANVQLNNLSYLINNVSLNDFSLTGFLGIFTDLIVLLNEYYHQVITVQDQNLIHKVYYYNDVIKYTNYFNLFYHPYKLLTPFMNVEDQSNLTTTFYSLGDVHIPNNNYFNYIEVQKNDVNNNRLVRTFLITNSFVLTRNINYGVLTGVYLVLICCLWGLTYLIFYKKDLV